MGSPVEPLNHLQLAKHVAEQDLPAFGLSLRQLLQATSSDSSSGQQVADIVLRDPALTSRVLRAANAAHLGLSGGARVVTVSRAVVVLGLNPIRSLCVSALAVESLGAGERLNRRVQQTLGRALHSAVQARDIGLRLRLGKAAAEQCFVEALLGHVGELAFWCFGGVHAQALDEALRAGEDALQAQQRILGISLQSFGRELLRAWNLDSVLREGREVVLAGSLSRQLAGGDADGQPWQRAPVTQTVRQIATLLGQGEAETLARLQDNAGEAMGLARALGAPEAADSIPAAGVPPAQPEPQAPQAAYTEPDPQQQLRVLSEMGQAARSRKELPLLFETCLEGLHRSVGLDRCVLCLLNPARNRLAARMAIGPASALLRDGLHWEGDDAADLQAGVDAPQWCKATETRRPSALLAASGAAEAFVAPLVVDGQWLGCFYADCQPSARELGAGQFESFQRFVWVTQLIVQSLAKS